jgi:hypothetical protein
MIGERRPVVTVYLNGDQSFVHVGPTNGRASDIDVDVTAPGKWGDQMAGEEVERRERGIQISREGNLSFGIKNIGLYEEIRAARLAQGLPVSEDFIEREDASEF